MAYVFRRIQDALGNESAQKQDIFSPQQSDAPQTGGEQVPGGVKTSTEGELGPGGMSGGSATGGEGAPAAGNTVDKALIQKNIGKTRAPKFAQQAQSDLATADQQLQDEANKYVSDYGARDYTVGTGTLDKAISGDASAMARTSGRLGETAERVEQFKPKTKYDFSDRINDFKTDAGIQNILRQESGPQYSAGEAAFDTSLLNRNADFQKIRSQLGIKQDELLKRAEAWGGASGEKTAAAQALVDKNHGQAQRRITGYLGGREKDLIAAQEKELADENAALAALRSGDGGQYLSDQAAAALKQLQSEYEGANKYGVAGYLDKSGVNSGDFRSVRGDYSDYRDFIDSDEASRFGNIYSLLGRSDDASIRNAMAGAGTTAREGFDAESYRDAVLRGAERANAGADTAAQAELDRILGDVRGRYATEADAYREQEAKNIADAVRAEFGDVDVNAIDSRAFWRDPNDDLSGLSEADAARLNELSQELEQGDSIYGAGKGFGSSFDSGSYLNALRGIMASKSVKDEPTNAAKNIPIGTDDVLDLMRKVQEQVNEQYKAIAKKAGEVPGAIADAAPNSVNDLPSTPQEVLDLADKSSGGNIGTAGKVLKKAFCFPSGVRFKITGGIVCPIEMIAVGDTLEGGGTVTDRHFGTSDDLYALPSGVLVTGEHAVQIAGRWLEAKNVPGALKIAGEFDVYNVTCENHVMIHETGAVLGDHDRDAED